MDYQSETVSTDIFHANRDSVLLTLDGVLVNTAEDLAHALTHTLWPKLQTPINSDGIKPAIGSGMHKLFCRSLRAVGVNLGDAEHTELFKSFVDEYQRNPVIDSRLCPGVADAIRSMKAEGLKLGVCANCPQATVEAILAMLGLDDVFDTVCGTSSSRHNQLYVSTILGAMSRLGSTPSTTVLVGSSSVELLAAKSVRVPGIAVRSPYRRLDERDYSAIVSSLDEVPCLIGNSKPMQQKVASRRLC